MKTRIIVAVIFVPLLFIVLFFLPAAATALLVAAISAIASYELLRAVGAGARTRLYVYTAAAAAALPLGVLTGAEDIVPLTVLFLLVCAVFIEGVAAYGTENKLALAVMLAAFFGGAVIPGLFSTLVKLRLHENGRYFILIPFIVAFVTDAGAYFTGVFFGKHKAFPAVSPKKTVEGCIGGIAACAAGMVVYGVILLLAAGLRPSFWALMLYGLVGGVVTEIGDLAFSLIKREYGVKDYGKVLPGHGGMLDRFDSMVFAAPALFLLVTLLPAF